MQLSVGIRVVCHLADAAIMCGVHGIREVQSISDAVRLRIGLLEGGKIVAIQCAVVWGQFLQTGVSNSL